VRSEICSVPIPSSDRTSLLANLNREGTPLFNSRGQHFDKKIITMILLNHYEKSEDISKFNYRR